MIEISGEIRYVMHFYYKKDKNAAKHFKKHTVKMLSVNKGLMNGLLNSVPEIWMSKIHLALIDQSLEKSKKFCNWWGKTTT